MFSCNGRASALPYCRLRQPSLARLARQTSIRSIQSRIPAADEHVKPILPTSLRQISSCTPVAKDAPAKALVWKQSRKPDWNGHKHYQAKTAAGCYSVAAEYQPGKGFIGYRVTQSVADKRRVIASSITVDEGKALAQRDYEQGDADERTRQALQPMTIRVPLG